MIATSDSTQVFELLVRGARPRDFVGTAHYDLAVREWMAYRLLRAAALGSVGDIRRAVADGAEVNHVTTLDDFMTPLIWAARCGQTRAVRCLLDLGASPRLEASFPEGARGETGGTTALVWASVGGHAAITALLLSRGADPNAQEYRDDDLLDGIERRLPGRTALTASTSLKVTELLLNHGADPNRAGAGGQTPLIIAASRGDRAQCEALLRGGAKKESKDLCGDTAETVARRAGFEDLANVIRDHGNK